jgi:hypothetical protein
MNVVEFIGFIAMMLFLLHSSRNKRRRQEEQSDEIEPEELEQAKRLKDFLQGIDSDMKPKPSPVAQRQQLKATPAPQPKKEVPKWEHSSPKQLQKSGREKPHKPHVETSWEEPYKDPYAIKKDAYAITEKRKSKAFYLKKRLRTPQDMVLWHEIMSVPVGMRDINPQR